jgi:hypothetical protein
MPGNLRNWLYGLVHGSMFRPALLTILAGLVLVSLPPVACLSYDASYLFRGRVPVPDLVLILFNDRTLEELKSDHNEHRKCSILHGTLLMTVATPDLLDH